MEGAGELARIELVPELKAVNAARGPAAGELARMPVDEREGVSGGPAAGELARMLADEREGVNGGPAEGAARVEEEEEEKEEEVVGVLARTVCDAAVLLLPLLAVEDVIELPRELEVATAGELARTEGELARTDEDAGTDDELARTEGELARTDEDAGTDDELARTEGELARIDEDAGTTGVERAVEAKPSDVREEEDPKPALLLLAAAI